MTKSKSTSATEEMDFLSDSDRLLIAARSLLSAKRRISQQIKLKNIEGDAHWVEEATRDPFVWVTDHAYTYNEHWKTEGRPSSTEHFPKLEYFRVLFDVFDLEEIIWVEKSRDMMVSWACVAYFTLAAMKTDYCGVVFQTQKDDKVIQLVEYAKHLYRLQDERIHKQYPLAKPLNQQSAHRLDFANGSYIVGIPGGANQIRSYHPWGYLNDESSFQADAGECYNEAISAVAGKIIFNSSAGPGWYADARREIIRDAEE